MIELDSLSKSFGRKKVLKNLSLKVKAGERIAIISPSGSGKTTLFRIISGLEKRFSGKAHTRGKVSYMFQEDRLFPTSTVLENVCALSDGEEARARELLSRLGLSDSLDLYPSDLSGGMKRRVALARALFCDFDVLLLDEPFTGLDPDTALSAAGVIKEETNGKTLLLVTHRNEEAEMINCTPLFFENGFIFEE